MEKEILTKEEYIAYKRENRMPTPKKTFTWTKQDKEIFFLRKDVQRLKFLVEKLLEEKNKK